MRLIALIIVVGSLILLGRWHSSLNESKAESQSRETGFTQASVFPRDSSILIAGRFEAGTSKGPAIDALPANAKRIRQLSRAVYELPRETATLLNQLFEVESGCRIETRIIEGENGLVTLEVTADDEAQRAVGIFLLAICPPQKIAARKEQQFDSDNQAAKIAFGSEPSVSKIRKGIDLSAVSAELH